MENDAQTRRDFIRRNGCAGAGLILGAPSMLRAADVTSPDLLRVAIIGFGAQGEHLMESMANLPGIRLDAVCDIWPSRLRKGVEKIRVRQGEAPRGYADVAEMLEKEKQLDAAIIATPDFWHAPHAILCMEAGLHVYCEKMMSNTLEGARSIVKAAERCGKLCQIGHQRRSNPVYRHIAMKLLKDHRLIGRVLSADARWIRTKSASADITVPAALQLPADILKQYGYQDMRHFLNWRWFEELSGGPISDLGAHQIDIFNWFLGSVPKRLFAIGGKRLFENRDHFDQVMVMFEYPQADGGVCRVNYQIVCGTSGGGGNHETFLGSEGTIVASEQAGKSSVYREPDAPFWDDLVVDGVLSSSMTANENKSRKNTLIESYESEAPEKYMLPVRLEGSRHTPHLRNFFESIRGREKLNCDARTAFLSEAVIHWINPAAIKGEPLVLEERHLSL